MKLSIGSTIRTLRKEKGISKESLSNSLHIPIALVDQWEKGDAYPDITLLPPIAKILDTDVDSLLMFETQLIPDEVMEINNICANAFETKDYDSALELCDEYLNKYPKSLFLKFRIGSLLQEYIQKSDSEEKANMVIEKSISLLEEATLIDDLEVKQAALYVLSSLYTMKRDYDRAIEILNALPKKNINPDFLLSTIYSITGEGLKAKKIEQESLFSNVNDTIISLTSMWGTALKERNIELAIELAKIQRNTIYSFNLESFLLGNNILMFCDISAIIKDEDLTLDYIESYIDWLNNLNQSSFDISKNKFFHLIEEFDNTHSIKNLKDNFISSVVENENYNFVKYSSRYKRILSKFL